MSASRPVSAATVRDLVAALPAVRGARPALTWYGTGDERVELSGRVLANWAVKAAGLLLDEADAGPGVRVALELPAHWRTLVWALGAWTAGAEVSLASVADSPPDVTVTAYPAAALAAHQRPGLVIAVALPALARRFPDLPDGAVDGAADLMTYPDVLAWTRAPSPEAPAISGGPAHARLIAWAHDAVGSAAWPPNARVLLHAHDGAAHVLAAALAAWAAGGSVVLLGDPRRDADALTVTERVTVTA